MKAFLHTLLATVRWRALILFLLMLLTSSLEGVSLLLVIPILSLAGIHVNQSHAHSQHWLYQLHLHLTLGQVLLIYCAIIITYANLQYWQSTLSTQLRTTFAQRLCHTLYSAVSQASWQFLAQQKPSRLSHLLTTEIMRVSSATFQFLQIMTSSCLVLVYGITALFLSWKFTLGLAAILLVLVFTFKTLNQKSKHKGHRWFNDMQEFYRHIHNHLGSLKLVKSFGLEDKHRQDLESMHQTLNHHQFAMAKLQATTSARYQIAFALIISLILYIALTYLHLPFTSLLLILLLATRIYPRVSKIHSLYQSFLNLLPAFEEVKAAERQAQSVQEPRKTTIPAPFNNSLILDNVSFIYDPTEASPRGVHQLSLEIQRGQMIALVGPSGAGKSTLADILAGLLQPGTGNILIDNQPLTQADQVAWRTEVGYVTQDAFILNDTVRNNLLLSSPHAPEDELWSALDTAQAKAFVQQLPEGLDTLIGGHGRQLSGGECQRLALARVLLRQPKLLILDEATSHLDTQNEKAIQQAILALKGHVTMVVIAHRLSTIKQADTIFILQEGRIVESGNWDTLSAHSRRFQNMICAGDI